MNDKVRDFPAEHFEAEVLRCERPVVVDFYSTECPPCEALAPKYDSLAAIYGDDIAFVKIFRQENRELATELNVTASPTVLFFQNGQEVGERLLGGIKRGELERSLKTMLPGQRVAELQERRQTVETECDLLVLGAGPAGLTAGIYAAQAKLRTIVVDPALAGGNLNVTHTISNFPGFPDPQPGYALAHRFLEQAKNAGVDVRQAVEVTSADYANKIFVLDELETIRARKVVVATGSTPRPLGVAGEKEYKGRGVSYCAVCDAKYQEGKHVVVIGGGNSAIEEALFIAKFADRVTIVHQFAELQANQAAQERAFSEPKIDFLFEHEPRAFIASSGNVDQVEVEELKTGARKTLQCGGVFVFAGMQPNLDGVDAGFELDEWGYVRVDEQMHTNLPDLFAVGDVRSKRYRQMTTAVSDGTIAAITIAQELAH